MLQLTPIVKNLIIVNVLVFIAAHTLTNIMPDLALYFPMSLHFKPYQLVSHFFMHANLQHLFFNMLVLVFIGPWVERHMGAKHFLIFYFLCAVGAFLMHYGIDFYQYSKYEGTIHPSQIDQIFHPIIGASGAVYGVLIGFATLYPNTVLQLLFPPIPIKAKYLAVLLIGFDLFSGIGNVQSGIAHFAHLGGALMGFLLVRFWIMKK